MPISSATLASRRTKRNIHTSAKDIKAERRMRLAGVVEAHGEGAIDVIRLETGSFPFKSHVYQVSGVSLLGLARLLHTTGRMRKVEDGAWVVYSK
jgi:hypothetical protein